MKKIFLILFIIIFISLIYNLTKDDKIYYLNIGDGIAIGKNSKQSVCGYNNYIIKHFKDSNIFEKYSNNYTNVNYRTTDIITLIESNVVDDKTSILNDLIKADVITISVGINDIMPYINQDTSVLENKKFEIIEDFKKLFYILRKNSKEKIYLIGIYNFNKNENILKTLYELNIILKNKANNYEITYIDIFKEMQNSENLDISSIYPTQQGYKMIANKIIELLD